MESSSSMTVENIDHLGLVAIVDEIGLVEQINELLGQHHQAEGRCWTRCQSNDIKRTWICITGSYT